ncbi:hypothetical protein POVWA2_002360 [Plasmodium ovale wallikeri]|uniref:Uncharacterized protein n=1 Tax=Plasmodium ovale wallikeri TaxID=864142 RepID=A0A1A8YHU2_PLAOA|nr:hypothetical protein POVWA2_002360 [Plasmodium ovale wallikeri]
MHAAVAPVQVPRGDSDRSYSVAKLVCCEAGLLRGWAVDQLISWSADQLISFEVCRVLFLFATIFPVIVAHVHVCMYMHMGRTREHYKNREMRDVWA